MSIFCPRICLRPICLSVYFCPSLSLRMCVCVWRLRARRSSTSIRHQSVQACCTLTQPTYAPYTHIFNNAHVLLSTQTLSYTLDL